jgi:hypothetical protein
VAKIILERPPQTDSELYYLVQALWGVTIPRHKVCPDHDAPFDAFADAYFERNGSIALWHGSRGLSGKSFMVSILGITKAFIKGADVNLLGGSLAQSTNIHEHMRNAFGNKNAPVYMIESEGNYLIKLNNRARIRPLTASQKTVRGPHPPFLICDEIDEMDEDILNAALGQPMPQKNYAGELIKPYTVMVSTWQNSDGCVLLNTPITTDSGIKNVQDVVVGDKVPTRDGWRSVTASINTGRQECVSVDFASGRRLTCTPWHRIWTDAHGWVEASLLQPGFVVSANVLGVGGTVFGSPGALTTEASAPVSALDVHVDMPVVADGLGHLDGKATGVVDGLRDDFQMAGVDTGSVATQVVDGQVVGNGSVDLHPYPAVGEIDTLSGDETSVGLVPVSVLTDAVGPGDAVVGRKIDGYTFAEDEVVRVTHTGMVLPTWDLTVDGSPEYVAEGILVHNTFEHKYREFQEKGLPIRTWCYKDTANPIDGWLSQETIEQKKREIPKEMWRVEYELGEPSIGNRAFDTDKVEETFSLPLEPIESEVKDRYERYVFEKPVGDGVYVVAADWAKEQDYTVITVMRVDRQPHTLVYYQRMNRRPYPVMISDFNKVIEEYNAEAIHDATGLGNVVNDYIDVRARKFIMSGEKRSNMLTEYVGAVERNYFTLPQIPSLYSEMKYCRTGDLYSNTKDYHLPDTVCSMALAWHLAKRHSGYGPAITVTKGREKNLRYEKHFEMPDNATDSIVSPMTEGVVVNKTVDLEGGINLLV